jgi:putative DNA primase/helicase
LGDVRGVVEGSRGEVRWYTWSGFVWEEDKRNRVTNRAKQVFTQRGDVCLQRAEQIPGERERKRAYKEAEFMHSNTIVKNAVTRLSWEGDEIMLELGSFDANPWVVNTPGGPIALLDDGLKVLDKDPDLLLSKATAEAPAKGKPEAWLKFIHESTKGDKELIRYLQKLLGYSLSGSVSEQILVFVWGPSHTGKSVFVSVVSHVFGSYHENTDIETFMSSRSGKVRNDEAALAGARLVTATETEEGRAWDETVVKAITAGDQRTVRHLYGHPFTYTPSYQILITGKNEPTIRTVDGAMRRRLHVVPFTHVVPVEQRDPALADKLKGEAPQILKWMLEGYVMWRREGLEPPAVVLAKTTEYFSEEDLISQWIEECCDVGDAYEETRATLYMSWQQWCNRGGYDPGTLKQLKRKLDRCPFSVPDRKVGDRRQAGNRRIRVKPAIAEGVDDNGF